MAGHHEEWVLNQLQKERARSLEYYCDTSQRLQYKVYMRTKTCEYYSPDVRRTLLAMAEEEHACDE